MLQGFPCGSVGKESAFNTGDAWDTGSIPGSGRSPGGVNGNLPQDSCLGNPKHRGAWQVQCMGSGREGHNWSNLSTYTKAVTTCLLFPSSLPLMLHSNRTQQFLISVQTATTNLSKFPQVPFLISKEYPILRVPLLAFLLPFLNLYVNIFTHVLNNLFTPCFCAKRITIFWEWNSQKL